MKIDDYYTGTAFIVLRRSQFKYEEDFENILRFLKLPETYDILRLPVIESYGGM
jgi:hypothetical protein